MPKDEPSEVHERLLLKRARGGEQPAEGGVVLLALVIAAVIIAGLLAKFV